MSFKRNNTLKWQVEKGQLKSRMVISSKWYSIMTHCWSFVFNSFYYRCMEGENLNTSELRKYCTEHVCSFNTILSCLGFFKVFMRNNIVLYYWNCNYVHLFELNSCFWIWGVPLMTSLIENFFSKARSRAAFNSSFSVTIQ